MKPLIVVEAAEVAGGRWSFDLLRDRLDLDAAATCFRGRDDEGRSVFVKQVERDQPDECKRAAREVTAHSRIGGHAAVLALLGTCSAPGGHSYRVFEWADAVLSEVLVDYPPALRPALAGAIEECLGSALTALHAVGLVHCDVAPNNVVRVEGRWKLADFDVCVPAGERTVGQPRLATYLTPGREVGSTAWPSYDWDGTAAVLAQVRGAGAQPVAAATRGAAANSRRV